MEMIKNKIRQYRAMKRELVILDKAVERLQDRAANIPTVLGKVVGSSPNFPYIQEHITVQMDEPKEAETIKRLLKMKQERRAKVGKMVLEIEQFIAAIPDSTDRQIFEMVFIDGKTLQKTGEVVGYTKGRVSQRISRILKD